MDEFVRWGIYILLGLIWLGVVVGLISCVALGLIALKKKLTQGG